MGKPSPRALATLRHHLRLRDRATSQAERDEIDLSIAILIGEEDERQRTAGATGTTTIASDMVRLNDESGWQRLASVWPWEVQTGGPRLVVEPVASGLHTEQARQRDVDDEPVKPAMLLDDDGYLTRERMLKAKRDHDAEGRQSQPIHSRLGVPKSTLLRHRKKRGLAPWLED